MKDKQILAEVLSELKRVSFPGSEDDAFDSEYWSAIEVRCDNATDEIVEADKFHKNLIKMIEDGQNEGA